MMVAAFHLYYVITGLSHLHIPSLFTLTLTAYLNQTSQNTLLKIAQLRWYSTHIQITEEVSFALLYLSLYCIQRSIVG